MKTWNSSWVKSIIWPIIPSVDMLSLSHLEEKCEIISPLTRRSTFLPRIPPPKAIAYQNMGGFINQPLSQSIISLPFLSMFLLMLSFPQCFAIPHGLWKAYLCLWDSPCQLKPHGSPTISPSSSQQMLRFILPALGVFILNTNKIILELLFQSTLKCLYSWPWKGSEFAQHRCYRKKNFQKIMTEIL